MLDVRNAIASILDRYTLADVVEVTTRKMHVDGIQIPFTKKAVNQAAKPKLRKRSKTLRPTDGMIHQLLGDYAI
jgi:hypothetical protein